MPVFRQRGQVPEWMLPLWNVDLAPRHKHMQSAMAAVFTPGVAVASSAPVWPPDTSTHPLHWYPKAASAATHPDLVLGGEAQAVGVPSWPSRPYPHGMLRMKEDQCQLPVSA